MLYTFYVPTTRIPMYMKIPECGLLEPKHVGEYIFFDNTIEIFVNCKCILLELPEQVHHSFP